MYPHTQHASPFSPLAKYIELIKKNAIIYIFIISKGIVRALTANLTYLSEI